MSSSLANTDTRILVVDDDPASAKLVRVALECEGYQVLVAGSGKEAIREMSDWNPHLVLLDVSMPGLNGLDTLKYLRARNHYVSTIFVSGRSDTDDVVRGLDAGADDYVCKPFDAKELLGRVRTQLRIKQLNDSLKAANKKLKSLVDKDDLTGLFNMRSLYEKLDNELNRARRFGRCVSVLMMDMDHFKSVNDSHDHLFGSFVLQEVGKIIRNNIRSVDFAARYGGDEFLIVLTEIGVEGASVFAERLKNLIKEYEFSQGTHSSHQTVSIGLAVTEKGNPTIDARSLVRYADHALYKAKAEGRDCVVIYDLKKQKGALDEPMEPNLLRKAR
ncbi:MAG: diguanylate cyclase [Bdellovibrionaceae bacterium]|nr:diguanylate cyclase [Bdellovibrionales bacterium]MCB9086338.1 diguanylate cyclase [Pseudobdellovibrionaceae bacterium]